MAYTAAVTINRGLSGCFELVITETDVAATSETEISLADPAGDGSMPRLPRAGRVVGRYSVLTSGTGTTIDPVLGDVTDPAASAGWLMENDTAAASIHEVPVQGIPYGEQVTSFFHRSVPDAGTDNAVTTVYQIRAGW